MVKNKSQHVKALSHRGTVESKKEVGSEKTCHLSLQIFVYTSRSFYSII